MLWETALLRLLAILADRSGTLLIGESTSDNGGNSMLRMMGESAGRRGQLHVTGEHVLARATAPVPSLAPRESASSPVLPPTAPPSSLVKMVILPSSAPHATLHAPALPLPATSPALFPRKGEAPPPTHASTHVQDGLRIFVPSQHLPFFSVNLFLLLVVVVDIYVCLWCASSFHLIGWSGGLVSNQ